MNMIFICQHISSFMWTISKMKNYVFITRCAARDWVLSLRASEVKYWTHLSTSDWGKDASSCRSSSSADIPCNSINTSVQWYTIPYLLQVEAIMFALKQYLYSFYLDTYIVQVGQGGCAQEESQINPRSPS